METNAKKFLIGSVVSDKMDKTIVVEHERTYRHKKFQKTIRVLKKYKVHDPKELASVGNVVEFYEGAPKSKTKYMYLHRVIS